MRTTLGAGVLAVCLAAGGVARAEDPKPATSSLGALEAARQKLDACAAKTKKSGTAKIHLKLAQDGTTSDVKVTGTGSSDLDACLANVLSTTTFPRGISFTLDVGLAIPTSSTKQVPARPDPLNPTGGMPDPDTAMGPDLDRATITAGIAKVKAKIAACGDASKAAGTVKTKVQVGADGKVTSATAEGSTDAALNACVAKTIKTATFAKTTSGGAFSYPFVFGTTETKLDASVYLPGMEKVRPKLDTCGDASKSGGKATATVHVAADGKVTQVTTDGSGDAQLDACVVAAIKTATFKATMQGGMFSVPFEGGATSAQPGPPAGKPVPPAGDALDRSTISAGVTKVKAKIAACGDASKVGGTVKAQVTVGADGKVTSATAEGSSDPALNTCVASTIKTATFAKSKSGGTFSYPFVFSTPAAPLMSGMMTAPSGASSVLERSMISAGITKVKALVGVCGDGKTKGVVKLKIVVAPAGTVSSVTVTQTPDQALGNCVASVLSKATFAKTGQGGTFTYPFVF